MKINDLKTYFFTELQNIYPTTEIQSFFNLLAISRLNLSRTDIALNPALKISEKDINYFKQAILKLKKQTPIQYIVGETEFYGLTFKVNPSVLIPRPETEELVAWVLSENNSNSTLTILDIGTGSGCIAVSIAKNNPNATVSAIDISNKALIIAKENALNNQVEINFIKSNILKINKLPDNYDVIVSNPPYVKENEKDQIKCNVLNYEPHLALFVKNENPLLFYNKIADLARCHLTKNGRLYFEINQYLSKETSELLKEKGFKNVVLKKDIYNNSRMIKATL